MKFEVEGAPTQVQWATPIENAWNYMRQIKISNSVLKRPDIGLSDRLLITSILGQPADQRPWGIVTWLADFYQTTRQTLYTIANSILYPFIVAQDHDQPSQSEPLLESEPLPNYQVERAILKMAFPGSVSIRPMREILCETLGVMPEVRFISQLLSRAGQLAGLFLSQLDYAHLSAIVALRDETFFNGKPILLLVEPRSGMIVHATVEDDRKSDTWATILLTLEDKNLQIKGLVEEGLRISCIS